MSYSFRQTNDGETPKNERKLLRRREKEGERVEKGKSPVELERSQLSLMIELRVRERESVCGC